MHLLEADFVLNRLFDDRHCEFCHQLGQFLQHVVIAELSHGESDGFVKAGSFDLEGVIKPLCVGETNPAARNSHAEIVAQQFRPVFAIRAIGQSYTM